MAVPVYSHGGPSMQGFPSVAGTAQSSGNPVYILTALVNPAFQVFFSGTSCTVLVEGNGGIIDPTTGAPPSGEWVDYSSGGIAMTNGQALSKQLPRSIPCWRTRISAINLGAGTGLTSYVPSITSGGDFVVSASRPPSTANAYNPNA